MVKQKKRLTLAGKIAEATAMALQEEEKKPRTLKRKVQINQGVQLR